MMVPKKIIALSYRLFLVIAAIVAIAAASASANDPTPDEPKVEGPNGESLDDLLGDIELANQINAFNANGAVSDSEAPWVIDTTDTNSDGLSQVQNLFAPKPGHLEPDPLTAVQ